MTSRFIKPRSIPKTSGPCLDQNNDGNCAHNKHTHKGTGLIDLSQIESGDEIFKSIGELIDKVEELQNRNFLVPPVKFEDLETDLKYKINNLQEYDDTYLRNQIQELKSIKVNRFELASYRRIDVPIEREDLSEELQNIIYEMEHNGYDDRWVREQIDLLKKSKMDRAEDVRFRKVNEFITIEDLDEPLKQLIGEISENTSRIFLLEETKADREELNNYRHKGVDISYNDLDKQLKAMLDSIEATDNTIILAKLAELDAKKANRDELDLKADKAELEDYRRTDVAITFDDLDAYLKSILDEIPTDFNPTDLQYQINDLKTIKVDRSELENYRSKAVLIGSNDLTRELNDRINANGGAVNLEELWAKINELETKKADLEVLCNYLQNVDGVITQKHLDEALQVLILNKANVSDLQSYRLKDVKITIEDLDDDILELINSKNLTIEDLVTRMVQVEFEIDSIIEELAAKASIEYVDGTFRRLDVKITEYDLDEVLKNKINSVLSEQNLSDLVEKVEYLLKESSKVNSEMNSAKGEYESLKEVIDSKLDITEAQEGYRSKADPIEENDLSPELQEKLGKTNTPHNDLEGLNEGDEYLHITRDEYDKFIGYETIIKDLIDRVIELEKQAGIQTPPTILSSSIDDVKDSVPISIGFVKLYTNSNDTTIEDQSKIVMEPNAMAMAPTAVNGTVVVSLTEMFGITEYTIKVLPGALRSGDLLNDQEYTLTFTTEKVEPNPVVSNCKYNDQINVPLDIDVIEFPVTSVVPVTKFNASKISVSDGIVKGEITFRDNTISIPVTSITEDTKYTIVIGANTVTTEKGTGNLELTNSFTTIDNKTKPIISNCEIHTAIDVTLEPRTITFEVACGEKLVLEDDSKYAISPEVESTIEVVDSKLIITTKEPFNEDTGYTITLEEGLVRDGDDLVNDRVVNTFRTVDIKNKPILNDMDGIAGNTLGIGKGMINIEVICEEEPILADASLISLAPYSITSTPTIEDNVISIPVNLLEMTEYTLTIAEGAVRNGDDLFNDEFVIEFSTNEEITEPVVLSCNVENKDNVDLELKEIIFDVEFSESLILLDDVFVTITPNVKNGKCFIREDKLVMPIANLAEDTVYTVKVDSNALKDGDDLPNSQIYTTTFNTSEIMTKPVISDCDLNGFNNVSLDTEKITFPVTFNERLVIANDDLITINPNVKKGKCTIREGKYIEMYLNPLTESTKYTVVFEEGAVRDGDDLVNDPLVNTFTTVEKITRPIISNCEINGRNDVDYNTLESITFDITVGESINIEDLSLITIAPNILFGEPRIEDTKLVLDVRDVKPNTSYTITIPSGVLRDGDDLLNEGLTNTFKTKSDKLPGDVEWEYKVKLEGVDNNFISYSDIGEAIGDPELNEVLFYSDNNEDYLEGTFAANPPIQVEYCGSEAYPLEEGMRIPRMDIDNGEICPKIEVPSYKPSGEVENYTMGEYIPDVDGIRFKSSPILIHIIRVVKYTK